MGKDDEIPDNVLIGEILEPGSERQQDRREKRVRKRFWATAKKAAAKKAAVKKSAKKATAKKAAKPASAKKNAPRAKAAKKRAKAK